MARFETWWEKEVPVGGPEGIRIGDIGIKHYREAEVVQLVRFVVTKKYSGPAGSGVAIHLDKMTPQDREQLAAALSAAILIPQTV